MTREAEGWSGNRLYSGSKWMDFYWAVDSQYADGNSMPRGPNGKFPNDQFDLYFKLDITAIFSATVIDSTNNFVQNGSTFPSQSGGLNIANKTEHLAYSQRVKLGRVFGGNRVLNIASSLTGIDYVPGTLSFNTNVTVPGSAYAVPYVPAVTNYTVDADAGKVAFTWSGNQNDPAQDRYWETVDVTIERENGWEQVLSQAGNKTSHEFTGLNPNAKYRVGVRAWNADGGVSDWSPFRDVYTKPAPVTLNSAVIRSDDLTKVDLAWTVNAAYPGTTIISRRATTDSAYSTVTTLPTTQNTYTDTVTAGTNYVYFVRTYTPDGKLVSDESNKIVTVQPVKKYNVPGIKEMYLGSNRISRVYFQNTELWKS